MDKDTLLKLSENLNLEYELGIWSEVTDFLERQEGIVDSSIKYSEGQYNVEITLKEFSLNSAKTIFASLVRFIEYKSTFYIREDKVKSFEYYLLSSTDNKKSFLLRVVFQ